MAKVQDLIGKKIANIRQHQGTIVFYGEDGKILFMASRLYDNRGMTLDTDGLSTMMEK